MPQDFHIEIMDILSCLNKMLSRDAAEAVTAGKRTVIAPMNTNTLIFFSQKLVVLTSKVLCMA